jgi:hypothetical protein
VQTFKNLPTTKNDCDEFEQAANNWLVSLHFLLQKGTPKNTNISFEKPSVTKFLGEKDVVVGFRHLKLLGFLFVGNVREKMVQL